MSNDHQLRCPDCGAEYFGTYSYGHHYLCGRYFSTITNKLVNRTSICYERKERQLRGAINELLATAIELDRDTVNIESLTVTDVLPLYRLGEVMEALNGGGND